MDFFVLDGGFFFVLDGGIFKIKCDFSTNPKCGFSRTLYCIKLSKCEGGMAEICEAGLHAQMILYRRACHPLESCKHTLVLAVDEYMCSISRDVFDFAMSLIVLKCI